MTTIFADDIAVESTAELFCNQFLRAFPSKSSLGKDSCEISATWMKVIDGQPTSGEGCFIDGLPVVEYYDGYEPTYLFGVLKSVCDFAESVGWRAELYNAGTVKFYQER